MHPDHALLRADIRAVLAALVLVAPGIARADNAAVDKIYHPYVQPLEREFELRAVAEQGRAGANDQRWRLGYGQALTGSFFAELYVLGEDTGGDRSEVSAYELEGLWQLTEQGEYAADWGLLFELEKERDDNLWEFSTALLAEREWGRWVGTANAHLIREWGDAVADEWETRLGLQARYRLSPLWEPAIEFHAAEDLRALGPALLGTARLGGRRKLHWEAGLFAGLDADSPDLSVRGQLEYEF